ncbi:tetratricopeptide repeat protein [Alkalinema pantanalense CENA528]|uniref:tetratricopeptide repeat protein n=1 Tax=Alkalinema pantanalense TaxID=1620705 RepID=UPI003D6E3CB8
MQNSALPQTIAFCFALVNDRQVELRCGREARRVEQADLQALVALCDRAYYKGRPKNLRGDYLPDDPQALLALGRALYDWLDGTEGWLRSRLGQGRSTLVFDLTASGEQRALNPALEALTLQVAHLPWELLADQQGMLLREGRMGVPVRVVAERGAAIADGTAGEPENRPLQMLFMATAPEGVTQLNFEQEELNILEATERQPLLLVTEESGSIAELKNLVASYDRDYFDVFNLTGHGLIYTQKEYGAWLAQMEEPPVLAEYTPCFVTESEIGAVRFSSVAEIAGAFGARFPKVIFLSGCHTGELADDGAVPSMAQQLVLAGAEVVLGWARPVYDRTGILAARVLYQALATGDTVTEAVGKTIGALVQRSIESQGLECSDWHLLRMYRSTREVGALVTPLNRAGRKKMKRRAAAQEFLGQEPVAGAREFVGRRRTLQRCLRALQGMDDRQGVFLHGMGGLGKSSIAARLCDRVQALFPQGKRVVIYGVVDEVILLRQLEDCYGAVEGVTEVLNNPKLGLAGRLQRFFELVEGAGKPLLLVLDDFEQNIPEAQVQDGSFRLVTGAQTVLAALGRGLEAAESRVIVTCRYACPLPGSLRLYPEQLGRMEPGDVRKQCQRLELDLRRELAQRLVRVADGNPRLLRWLSEVLTAEDWVAEDLEGLLGRLEAVETRFRENLLLEVLLGGLGPEERRSLARWAVVQVPLPEGLLREWLGEVDLEKWLGLTLVEPSRVPEGEGFRVPLVVRGGVEPELSEGERQGAMQEAVRLLHRVWWEEATEGCETERALEVVRLGLAAQDWEIAVAVGDAMATAWVNRSRYVEAKAICEQILAVHEDYRIWHALARAQVVVGETNESTQNYEKALSLCPTDDDLIRAAIFSNLANSLVQQGEIDRALGLWQASLELLERIGDVQGKAATLNNMALVVAQQGEIDRALGLWQASLELLERIGDVQGKAITLANMAGTLANRGEFETAIAYLEESIQLLDRIRDVRVHQVRQMLEQTRQMQAMAQSPFAQMLMGLAQQAAQSELSEADLRQRLENLDPAELLAALGINPEDLEGLSDSEDA